jgi:hypothetical protein
VEASEIIHLNPHIIMNSKVILQNKITGLYYVEGSNFNEPLQSKATRYPEGDPAIAVVKATFSGVEVIPEAKKLELPPLVVKTDNSITMVGPYSAGGAVSHTAAKLGYLHGAETMAKMFRETFMTGDLAMLHELVKATETFSFYGKAK